MGWIDTFCRTFLRQRLFTMFVYLLYIFIVLFYNCIMIRISLFMYFSVGWIDNCCRSCSYFISLYYILRNSCTFVSSDVHIFMYVCVCRISQASNVIASSCIYASLPPNHPYLRLLLLLHNQNHMHHPCIIYNSSKYICTNLFCIFEISTFVS